MKFIRYSLLICCLAASASAQILQEDFEQGIPATWDLSFPLSPSAMGWQSLANNQCGAVSGMAGLTTHFCGTSNPSPGIVGDTIGTRPITLTGPGPYTVQFDSILTIDPLSDLVSVYVQPLSATPAVVLATNANFQLGGQPENINLIIPSTLEGETVIVKFRGRVPFPASATSVGWLIDNLRISGASGESYCFADGSLTPCPCGNDTVFANSGCLNSASRAASLSHQGAARISADTLALVVQGGVPNSVGVLLSADNRLPAANPGAGFAAHDGLRCIGGNLQRHGLRQFDPVNASAAWGLSAGLPVGGLLAQSGFSAGQTRQWQVVYRDDPAGSCGTGLNSSNAIEITFSP